MKRIKPFVKIIPKGNEKKDFFLEILDFHQTKQFYSDVAIV